MANHTLLKQYAIFNTFILNYQGTTHKEGILPCSRDYFLDTINAVPLEDCFIFPANRAIDFSFYNWVQSSFGFTSKFTCTNPFSCASGDPVYVNSTNNYASIFSTYSFTLYFTSRTLTQSGDFQDELLSLSSTQWDTPLTETTDIKAELQLMNVSIDDSILPWKN